MSTQQPPQMSKAEVTSRALESLKRALPACEWRAVRSWASTFYRFQNDWLFEWSRYALFLKARQIGVTHASSAAAVLWGLLGERTMVISVGEREASEVIECAARHAKALEALGSEWARPLSATRTTLRLASGGRILALPATSGGRSYSGNVILDEFAYHERPEMVWDGAAGAVTHGFKLRVVSTPNGVGNLFYRLCHDTKTRKGYSIHRSTIDDAIADGLKVDEKHCWALAHGDARVFDQMYRCSFLDNEQQYIPTALVNEAIVDALGVLEAGEYYAGLDIGRTADLTVLIVIYKDERGVCWVVHVESRKRTSEDDLDALMALAVESFGCRRVCIDASGLGAFPAERMQKRYGRHRVEPLVFTQLVKEDLATTMYSHFAERALRIPASETKLREDICSLRRIVTTAGNIRYDAPHTPEGHADSAWSLALALHGCSGPDRAKRVIHDHDEAAE